MRVVARCLSLFCVLTFSTSFMERLRFAFEFTERLGGVAYYATVIAAL